MKYIFKKSAMSTGGEWVWISSWSCFVEITIFIFNFKKILSNDTRKCWTKKTIVLLVHLRQTTNEKIDIVYAIIDTIQRTNNLK